MGTQKPVKLFFDFFMGGVVTPIAQKQFAELLTNRIELAFADQIIYRFSKAQDTIGAKLFKAFLLYL